MAVTERVASTLDKFTGKEEVLKEVEETKMWYKTAALQVGAHENDVVLVLYFNKFNQLPVNGYDVARHELLYGYTKGTKEYNQIIEDSKKFFLSTPGLKDDIEKAINEMQLDEESFDYKKMPL